jgi:uncharacterized protein (TIGR00297 family)
MSRSTPRWGELPELRPKVDGTGTATRVERPSWISARGREAMRARTESMAGQNGYPDVGSYPIVVVLSLLASGIGIAATAVLATLAVLGRALTPSAGAVAAIFGAVIVVAAGYPFLALLVLFVVASSLATRLGFDQKSARKVQEGIRGERGISNVLAHILLPTAIALAVGAGPGVLSETDGAILFASALSFGAADTFASEIGVLSGSARSILTGRLVEPGTNGGVSLPGEAWAFVGALATAVIGAALFALFGVALTQPGLFVALVALAGFVGCQIDSILGETLENRGLLTKGSTNFLGMLSAALVALGGLWWLGPH